MKQQSERTLILAGSLFLVGLIIADVLTQHLNQLELFNEETKSALLFSSFNHADAHPAAQKNKYEKQSEINWIRATETKSRPIQRTPLLRVYGIPRSKRHS